MGRLPELSLGVTCKAATWMMTGEFVVKRRSTVVALFRHHVPPIPGVKCPLNSLIIVWSSGIRNHADYSPSKFALPSLNTHRSSSTKKLFWVSLSERALCTCSIYILIEAV
jgi:hypothetical protein